MGRDINGKNSVLILKKAIETANDSIRKKAAEDISYEGMGNPDKNKVGVPTSMNRSAG